MKVKRIEVFLYDLHVFLDPLLGEANPLAPLEFLLNESAYVNAFDAHGGASPLQTANGVEVRSIRRELDRNHFWRHFSAGKNKDAWTRHLPFIARPPNWSFQVDRTGNPPVDVRAFAFLWPWGWSTNFEFHVEGPLTLGEARQVVDDCRMIRLRSKSRRAATTFRRMMSLILEALFGPNADVTTRIRIQHSKVIALQTDGQPGYSAMPAIDQADVHGVFHGRPFGIPDLVRAQEGQDRFFVTNLSGDDYAISYLNHGSLLVLDRSQAATPRSLHCLADNVRTADVFARGLIEFMREADHAGPSTPELQSLRAGAASALPAIYSYYSNRVTRGLFVNHSKLKPYRT